MEIPKNYAVYWYLAVRQSNMSPLFCFTPYVRELMLPCNNIIDRMRQKCAKMCCIFKHSLLMDNKGFQWHDMIWILWTRFLFINCKTVQVHFICLAMSSFSLLLNAIEGNGLHGWIFHPKNVEGITNSLQKSYFIYQIDVAVWDLKWVKTSFWMIS